MKPLLSHQVPSEPVGGGVGQEDDALGKTVASAVDVGLLQGRLIRSVQLGLVHVHEALLFAQTCDGADVVQRLAGNLSINDSGWNFNIRLKESFLKQLKTFSPFLSVDDSTLMHFICIRIKKKKFAVIWLSVFLCELSRSHCGGLRFDPRVQQELSQTVSVLLLTAAANKTLSLRDLSPAAGL